MCLSTAKDIVSLSSPSSWNGNNDKRRRVPLDIILSDARHIHQDSSDMPTHLVPEKYPPDRRDGWTGEILVGSSKPLGLSLHLN